MNYIILGYHAVVLNLRIKRDIFSEREYAVGLLLSLSLGNPAEDNNGLTAVVIVIMGWDTNVCDKSAHEPV